METEGYTAADPQLPEDEVVTLASLKEDWAYRDGAYAGRSTELTDANVQGIRVYRRAEVLDLPPADRAAAWAIANSWVPPKLRPS